MLIGLTGYKRNGKDTTADILVEFGFKKFAFADALRKLALAADPYIHIGDSSDLLYAFSNRLPFIRYSELLDAVGYEKAKEAEDFRLFLQHLGSEGGRAVFGENVWVDALQHARVQDFKGRSLVQSQTRHVITDVRFPNEAEYVHDQGGLMIRINRPGVGGDDGHVSEAHVASLPVDRVITAASLFQLEYEVRAFVRVYGLDKEDAA